MFVVAVEPGFRVAVQPVARPSSPGSSAGGERT